MRKRPLSYRPGKQPLVLALCLPLLISACNMQAYSAKPLDSAAISHKLALKSPDSASFNQYLLDNGYRAEQLPLQQFGLQELNYCALYFHPSLDTARAQWRSAELAESAAGKRQPPSISGHLAHSNQANGDIRPFALGLSIDIPLETQNKRDIRIENARHLSEAAKLEIAQTAWELRNQLGSSWYEYQFNQASIQLLSAELALRQQIVALYQKRVSLGMASNIELSTARLQLQTTSAELSNLQQAQYTTQAKLAGNLGLSVAQLQNMRLVDSSLLPTDKPQALAELQRDALLNRLDMRIALERYAATEAKLKLEIANQYPDLSLSPGYAYEFGDKIWSLGISSLLSLLDKNKIAINEATQLREVEAAQFIALQSKVLAEVGIANAALIQAQQAHVSQQALSAQQQQNSARMQRLFNAGEIDRLELAYAKLEQTAAEKSLLQAKYQLQIAQHVLENTLQKPLPGINAPKS